MSHVEVQAQKLTPALLPGLHRFSTTQVCDVGPIHPQPRREILPLKRFFRKRSFQALPDGWSNLCGSTFCPQV